MNITEELKDKNSSGSLSKEIPYRGDIIKISVELNYRIERRINGRVEHRVITKCEGYREYYKTEIINDKYLVEGIEAAIRTAKLHLDTRLGGTSNSDQRLQDLGFKELL